MTLLCTSLRAAGLLDDRLRTLHIILEGAAQSLGIFDRIVNSRISQSVVVVVGRTAAVVVSYVALVFDSALLVACLHDPHTRSVTQILC